MNVLITGAAGFIGSHVAERMVGVGHEVWGVDDLTTGRLDNFPDAELHLFDIADRHRLYDLANRAQPELVVHCAASYSDPNLWHRDTNTNVTGTINATLAAQHHGARLVYFQTALPPISSYAISKIAGEQYIVLSAVPALVFRLANIYGPRNLSGPIPTFYKRLTARQDCTVVDTRRDMVYISDLVRLVTKAVGASATGKYDVCSGTEYAIHDLYDAVASTLDVTAVPDHAEAGPDDVKNMELDPVPAFRDFGWRPSTPLREGVARACAWYEQHGVGDTYTHLALKG